jgi:hypothetical protein
MSERKIIVLKFGSSVLRTNEDLPAVVNEIYEWWLQDYRVVAVVSAFGNTTDQLTQRAYSVCVEPDPTLLAALLATGEAASSALWDWHFDTPESRQGSSMPNRQD